MKNNYELSSHNVELITNPDTTTISAGGPTREDSINHIEALYPPDTDMKETARIGQKLLDKLVATDHQPADWRDLPDEHLHRLALANLLEAEEKELAKQYIN